MRNRFVPGRGKRGDAPIPLFTFYPRVKQGRETSCRGEKIVQETKFLDSKKYLWGGFAACLAILDQGEGFLGDFQIIRFPRQEKSIFDCFSFLFFRGF